MKSIKLIILVLMAGVLLAGCSLEPNHSIRAKNNYYEAIFNLKAGTVNFGTVASGSTTSYFPIDEGSYTLSGNTVSGAPLQGSLSISGKGTHKWTMTIEASGTITIQED
jgi:hypothetical protein